MIESQSSAKLRERLPRTPTIAVAARGVEPRGARALAAIGREIAAGLTRIDAPARRVRSRAWRGSFVTGPQKRAPAALAGPGTRLLLFGGKGGVGKTTCAAAAALAIGAAARKPVLLVSADPAHSLGDVFGQRVGDTPTRLCRGPAGLRVREIDAARELERIRSRYARGIDALFDRFAAGGSASIRVDASRDRDVMHGLIELAPPGLDELAAMIEVMDSVESNGAGVIVMDTAPTGHALRLLEMPALVHGWTKALMSILLKYQPIAGIGEFGSVVVKLSQGLGRLRALLSDPDRTSFVVVTRGAVLPLEETRRLVRRLTHLNIHVPALVVNAVGRGSCSRCRSEALVEARHIRTIGRDFSRSMPVLIAPAELPPPRGPAALGRWRRRWAWLR